MRAGLIALDERPVNTRYPSMIADIAGVDLVQPPPAILSSRRQPADCNQLLAWLEQAAAGLDTLIVSVEMLGYGGLIASRTTDDATAEVINRLDALRAVRQRNPNITMLAFDLIMRISRADDSFEEPLYWSQYGSRFYRYSQLIDQQLQGREVANELAEIDAQLPREYRHDFLSRRLRNHIINLCMLQMVADGVTDLLVISSDDTSEYGLGTREKRWISEWAERLLPDDPRLLMYPGADEVGSALLTRAINRQQGQTPGFALHYAIPGDEEVTAPFEDGPVRITLARQVRAVGGQITADSAEADFIVVVNTPSRYHPMLYAEYNAAEEAHRMPYLEPLVQQIQAWVDSGRRVIVADVAYPNGADPVLVRLLLERVEIHRLAAYGAWNTAGNTIGVALSQGIASALARTNEQKLAQQRFLTHRFLEDWGYQFSVRSEVRKTYIERYGTSEIAPDHLPTVRAEIEAGLRQRLAQLPYLGDRWRIVPGSIRLPWDRFFEVDFDLEPLR